MLELADLIAKVKADDVSPLTQSQRRHDRKGRLPPGRRTLNHAEVGVADSPHSEFHIMAKNVFGGDLISCSMDPVTGFFRTGTCDTCGDDGGMHTVCAEMTAEFLEFSRLAGNDLSTPRPEYQFPGLAPGDRWCLCLPRWLEALDASAAPKLLLEATHMSAIEHISMETLLEYGLDADKAPRRNMDEEE